MDVRRQSNNETYLSHHRHGLWKEKKRKERTYHDDIHAEKKNSHLANDDDGDGDGHPQGEGRPSPLEPFKLEPIHNQKALSDADTCLNPSTALPGATLLTLLTLPYLKVKLILLTYTVDYTLAKDVWGKSPPPHHGEMEITDVRLGMFVMMVTFSFYYCGIGFFFLFIHCKSSGSG